MAALLQNSTYHRLAQELISEYAEQDNLAAAAPAA
jgi:hypothetical protein